MASTRNALRDITSNVDESMGVRQTERQPRLSPVASAKDIGRTPLRKFGTLSLDQIAPDPDQPRTEFDEEEIQNLAGSISSRIGQLHPIRVKWNEQINKWIVVTGERRYRAAMVAGLSQIDCYFHDQDITESEKLEQQLVENLLRQDLKPLEEARGYAALMELNNWNGKQVAEALRVSTSKVSRGLALLDLPPDVQARINSGEIPRSSAYELSKLDNPESQSELADKTATGELTQRTATKAVRQRKGKATKARGIRQTFQAENGLKVTVSANRKGNYFEIEEALQQALDEVRHRIDNGMQLY